MGTEVWVLAQGPSSGQGGSPVGPAGPRSCVPTACLPPPTPPHRPSQGGLRPVGIFIC